LGRAKVDGKIDFPWRYELKVIRKKSKYTFYDKNDKVIIMTVNRKIGEAYAQHKEDRTSRQTNTNEQGV
jgi:hypothetical protein